MQTIAKLLQSKDLGENLSGALFIHDVFHYEYRGALCFLSKKDGKLFISSDENIFKRFDIKPKKYPPNSHQFCSPENIFHDKTSPIVKGLISVMLKSFFSTFPGNNHQHNKRMHSPSWVAMHTLEHIRTTGYDPLKEIFGVSSEKALIISSYLKKPDVEKFLKLHNLKETPTIDARQLLHAIETVADEVMCQ